MQSHFFSVFAFLFCVLNTVSAFAQDIARLPQMNSNISIPVSESKALKEYFVGHSADLTPPDSVNKLLTSLLPQYFDVACTSMNTRLPENQKGYLYTNAIHVTQVPNARVVFFVFGCFVDSLEFRDERIGFLLLDEEESIIRTIAHGEDCPNCVGFDRVAFEGVFISSQPLVFGIRVNRDSDKGHPCCDGVDGYEESELLLYKMDKHNVEPAGKMVNRLLYASHDHETGDTVSVYEADLEYHKNEHGNVIEIEAQFQLKENDVIIENGIKLYTWDAASELFLESQR